MFCPQILGTRLSASYLTIDLPLVVVVGLVHCFDCAIENIDSDRLSEALSPAFAFEDDEDHRDECQHSSNQGEHQEGPLVSDRVTEIDDVEGKSETDFLTNEVEQLSDLASFGAIAVNGICIGRRGDDL